MTHRWTALLVALACTGSALAAPQYGGGRRNPPAPPAGSKAPSTGGDSSTGSDTKSGSSKKADAQGETRFYERMDPEDRAALEVNVGYLLPEPTLGVNWIGAEPMKRDDFRGKVTVLQSIGGRSTSRAALEKTKKALPEGAVLVAVHTPDGADRAKATFDKNPPCPVAVDADGAWCDALGIWKRPVNIVVDKTGSVRYVGLSEAGLKEKLPALMAEEVDDSVQGKERPAAAGAEATKEVEWPTFTMAVDAAQDKRGQKIPEFAVDQWITAAPTPGNRLVAIDFWATWCGPCKKAIPHVNELNGKYGNDVLFVGISDETKAKFNSGLKSSKLDASSFTYALALDPKARLQRGFFGITGIPHMAIFSPDGIVRWQGHPMSLREEDLQAIIAANKSHFRGSDPKARGWAAAGAAKKASAR
ncbi:MAG: redoxin domain-containing protein [Phycisphaerales bacterium]